MQVWDYITTSFIISLFWLALGQIYQASQEAKRFQLLNELADARIKYSRLASEYNQLLDILDDIRRPSQQLVAAYKVFGLAATASEQEVKNRFRSLVKKYHPDQNKSPDANKKFEAINNAYKIIRQHLNIQ